MYGLIVSSNEKERYALANDLSEEKYFVFGEYVKIFSSIEFCAKKCAKCGNNNAVTFRIALNSSESVK